MSRPTDLPSMAFRSLPPPWQGFTVEEQLLRMAWDMGWDENRLRVYVGVGGKPQILRFYTMDDATQFHAELEDARYAGIPFGCPWWADIITDHAGTTAGPGRPGPDPGAAGPRNPPASWWPETADAPACPGPSHGGPFSGAERGRSAGGEPMEGDWRCRCGHPNFGRHPTCRKCGGAAVDHAVTRVPLGPCSWQCRECGGVVVGDRGA